MFEKVLTYVKQMQYLGLLAPFAFGLSVFMFTGPIMLPYLMLSQGLSALLKIYEFYKAPEKTLHPWLGLVSSLLAFALLASSYLLVASFALYFPAAILLFASLGVHVITNVITIADTLVAALKLPKGNLEREVSFYLIGRHLLGLTLGSLFAGASTYYLMQIPYFFPNVTLVVGGVILGAQLLTKLVVLIGLQVKGAKADTNAEPHTDFGVPDVHETPTATSDVDANPIVVAKLFDARVATKDETSFAENNVPAQVGMRNGL